MKNHDGRGGRDLFAEMVRRDDQLHYAERSIEVGEAVLRLVEVSSRPRTDCTMDVVFVSGWASTIATWRHFIPAICTYGRVCYLETREKPSSRVVSDSGFSPSALASDVAMYVEQTFGSRKYALIGASTGANVVIESWRSLRPKPRWMALVLPHVRTPIPRYVLSLRLVPGVLLPTVRRLLLATAKSRLVPSRVAAQREGIVAALDTADLKKLRASAVAWQNYALDLDVVRGIDTRTMVVGGSLDPMHSAVAARTVLSGLSRGGWLDAATFAGAHGSRTAAAIVDWASEPDA